MTYVSEECYAHLHCLVYGHKLAFQSDKCDMTTELVINASLK